MNNKGKSIDVIAWVLFFLAIGFFCLQVGYFLGHEKYQIEYIDNRLFYIINICFVICLFFAVVLLLRLNKISLWFTFIIGIVLIAVNIGLCISNNQQVRNIVSISPDFKHVLSIKEDRKKESIYYRSSFLIFARPTEKLPYEMNGEFKVEWLANDIAAFTYKAKNQTVHQFIATYGDRNSGLSYYNVGPEIQGKWQGGDLEMISDTDGITVIEKKGITERYDWDHIVQFGTLAIVLMKNNEPVWTIALDTNFKVESDSSKFPTNEIILYRATMEENQPIQMQFKGLN